MAWQSKKQREAAAATAAATPWPPPATASQLSSPASFSVEKALHERLGALHQALIQAAEANDWDPLVVDTVLKAGGLPPLTREYVVQYVEPTPREVRVRAKSPAQASEIAGVEAHGMQLTGVRELPEE